MEFGFDAILIVAFGGPEKREDVMPFLENVVRGKNVPKERLLEVAHHYELFDGVSPINAQTRALAAALLEELNRHDIDLPLYWGNRNWHPLLTDTLRQMTDDGVKRALAFVVSAYGSYSSCRQYREDIDRARGAAGLHAPAIEKIRLFFNHPGFIAANADRLNGALEKIPSERRSRTHVAFTAHSLPVSMAEYCEYESQLAETCRLVSQSLQIESSRWRLVYQSRSGRPSDPWLGPDILDHLHAISDAGVVDVVIMPVGFLSDHIEVLYDLDVEARQTCNALEMNMIRAPTVGTHEKFVQMIRELIEERVRKLPARRSLGKLGPSPDVCADDCCLKPSR